MSDPIERLEKFATEGDDMIALSPAEVRRRGDRLRRRNRAVGIAGAAAAVALVIAPLAVWADHDDRSEPPVTSPSSTPSATQASPSASSSAPSAPPSSIPEDFPIDRDPVDMTGDGGQILGPGAKVRGAPEVSPCDRVVWPATGVDRLAFTTTGPEFAESRELVTFGSADQAVAAMADVGSAITACPTEVNELDPTSNPEQAWDVLEADTGYEDSVTFSLTYTDGMPGGQIWQLTRVGKAIVAVSTEGEYSRGQSTAYAADRLTELTGHLTPEMCIFTEAGC